VPGRRTKKPIPPGLPKADPRDIYVREGVSLEDLAKRLKGRKGCSLGNLERRCRKEKWGEQRSEWERKAQAETDARTVVTAAEHRARQLARIRRIEDAGETALAKLEHRLTLKRGDRLLGEKQGVATALKEVTQILTLALDATSELVDDRDDRFAALLAHAEEIAGEDFSEVTDLSADEEVLEAMTPRGLDDLAHRLAPAVPAEPEQEAS